MKRYTILLYCFLAFFISWTSKILFVAHDENWIANNFPKGIFIFIAQFGPSLAGLIVIYLENGKRGLFSVTRSLTRMHISLKWYIFAIFFELALFHIIILFCYATGYKEINIRISALLPSYLSFLVNTITLTILTGLGEEIGWRGFLLPKLQERYKIVIAALALTLINSMWHLRTDCLGILLKGDLPGFSAIYFPDMALRILISAPVILIIIYLFNYTIGSLLIMILYHGSANASYEWVKEITRNNDPAFILPVFAVFLWITMIFFVPAVIKQQRNNELVIRVG
jgi:membrane protease YdiL (CAAX protease family)